MVISCMHSPSSRRRAASGRFSPHQPCNLQLQHNNLCPQHRPRAQPHPMPTPRFAAVSPAALSTSILPPTAAPHLKAAPLDTAQRRRGGPPTHAAHACLCTRRRDMHRLRTAVSVTVGQSAAGVARCVRSFQFLSAHRQELDVPSVERHDVCDVQRLHELVLSQSEHDRRLRGGQHLRGAAIASDLRIAIRANACSRRACNRATARWYRMAACTTRHMHVASCR